MMCVRYLRARNLLHFNFNLRLPVNNNRHLVFRNTSQLSSYGEKYFVDNENKHAHSVMKNIPGYQKTLVNKTTYEHLGLKSESIISNNGISNFIPADLVQNFLKFSSCAEPGLNQQDDATYQQMITSLTVVLPKLTDKQLIDCLHAVYNWTSDSERKESLYLLCCSLDDECSKRVRGWSINRALLVGDYFCQLRLYRSTRYYNKLIEMLVVNIRKLEKSHIVQLFFFINLVRQISRPNMAIIEERLLDISERLSVEELGIVALGYFKTQTPIQSRNLVKVIVKKLERNIDGINNFTFTAIIKALRKSATTPLTDLYESLLNSSASLPQLQSLNIKSSLHLSLLGTPLFIYNQELYNHSAHKLINNFNQARVKDISKFLFCFAEFCHDAGESRVYQRIVEELEQTSREEELNYYGGCLISSLYYLSCVGIYPDKLLDRALQLKFIRKIEDIKGDTYLRETYALDCSVEIERPDYRGSRLDKSFKETALQRYPKLSPYHKVKKTANDRYMLEVVSMVADLCGGPDYVRLVHLLPHYQIPDLVLLLDEERKPQVIPQVFADKLGEIVRPPSVAGQWTVLVVGGRSFYCHNSTRPLGTYTAKMRQLRRLGYQVTEVPWVNIADQKDRSAKRKYLTDLLGIHPK